MFYSNYLEKISRKHSYVHLKNAVLRCAKTHQVTYLCIEMQLHVRCKIFLYILIYNHVSCIISQYENCGYHFKKQMRKFSFS